jgi:hypothetical protein
MREVAEELLELYGTILQKMLRILKLPLGVDVDTLL